MAGDWIKMRCELQTHPKIVRILSATQSDKFRVIGGLHAVWGVFDAHSKDGSLFGYTPKLLDHVIGWDGFSNALIAVEWLSFDGTETLYLPDFDEHNSKSAKRRAEDQKRKRDDRKCPQNVHIECGQIQEKNRTREEKRREDNKPIMSEYSDEFERFWTAYPKKRQVGKGGAWKSWKTKKPDLNGILSALAWQTKSTQWTKDGGQFIPMPATYLNQRRWEDTPPDNQGGKFDMHEFLKGK